MPATFLHLILLNKVTYFFGSFKKGFCLMSFTSLKNIPQLENSTPVQSFSCAMCGLHAMVRRFHPFLVMEGAISSTILFVNETKWFCHGFFRNDTFLHPFLCCFSQVFSHFQHQLFNTLLWKLICAAWKILVKAGISEIQFFSRNAPRRVNVFCLVFPMPIRTILLCHG